MADKVLTVVGVVNEFIARLMAIDGGQRDIHYNSSGPNMYGDHLLMDKFDWLQYLDDLKEKGILGNNAKVLPSMEYRLLANEFSVICPDNTLTSFKTLLKLVQETHDFINKQKFDKGLENLIGSIDEELKQDIGLLLLRTLEQITEGEHHNGVQQLQ